MDPTNLVAAGAFLLLVGAICYLAIYYWTEPTPVKVGEVRSLVIYPLKSARGIPVQTALLDERGLAFDRQWMVVDERGNFLSQRRAPRLAVVQVELPTSQDGSLRLFAPGAQPIAVPTVRRGWGRSVRCWDDRVASIDQGDAAAKWFEAVLGVEGCRLVRMADDAQRQVSRKYAHKGSQTALSDGFPVLMANEASLADLNTRLQARGKKTIPMDRFRPNLIIGSSTGGDAGPKAAAPGPWAEDTWSRIQVVNGTRAAADGVPFGVVKPCARCKMPTINQQTGVPDQRGSSDPVVASEPPDLPHEEMDEGGGPAAEAEPTATLKTFRTGAKLGYAKPGWAGDVFFGQNVLPGRGSVGRILSVGDAIVATPRRPAGWFSRGVRGVDYWRE